VGVLSNAFCFSPLKPKLIGEHICVIRKSDPTYHTNANDVGTFSVSDRPPFHVTSIIPGVFIYIFVYLLSTSCQKLYRVYIHCVIQILLVSKLHKFFLAPSQH